VSIFLDIHRKLSVLLVSEWASGCCLTNTKWAVFCYIMESTS